MAFREYIRRYMEEGPAAEPWPKTVIGYWPSPKEAWLSVTQWFPVLQQKGLPRGQFVPAKNEGAKLPMVGSAPP